MKQERKFLRQCKICKEYKRKELLIRITRDYKTGAAEINKNNSIQGRSIYVCKDDDCIKRLIKNKKILSGLKPKDIENIKENLATVLTNQIVLQL